MRLLIFCLLACCAGCSITQQFSAQIPEEKLLTELSADEIFAIHPNGDSVAYVKNGLELLRLSDGYRQRLLFDAPDAIIWSSDGQELVAAISEAEKTRIVKLTANEDERVQVFVDERISAFAWLTEGRLLALAQKLERRGDERLVKVSLLIWDGSWNVERRPLYEYSYLRMSSAPSSFSVKKRPRFSLSPLKDELIYNRFDPAGESGQSDYVLHNLQTGREQILGTGYGVEPAQLTADGEHVLLPQGRDVVYLNPWNQQVSYQLQAQGRALQVAEKRDLFFVGGNLYAQNQLLLRLPADSRAQFSSDGSRLFVANRAKLYLFSGYPLPESIEYTALERLKLQRIRQQRSRGDIGIREYYQARNNILHP